MCTAWAWNQSIVLHNWLTCQILESKNTMRQILSYQIWRSGLTKEIYIRTEIFI